MNSNQLNISNLEVIVENKKILHGVNVTVKSGEIHVIMGPNGSGKSTLAKTLAGHPSYQVIAGSVAINSKEILSLSPDERAKLGLFLAFQYPVEVHGVRVQNFLRLAYEARFSTKQDKLFKKAIEFRKYLKKIAKDLQISEDFLARNLNEGFSGGEKKQLEILQMKLLEPKFAILDETDSGLDIDAIKKVAAGVQKIIKDYKTGVILITHYQRILNYLKPDFVHIMINGRIIESGNISLVKKLEKYGYKNLK